MDSASEPYAKGQRCDSIEIEDGGGAYEEDLAAVSLLAAVDGVGGGWLRYCWISRVVLGEEEGVVSQRPEPR